MWSTADLRRASDDGEFVVHYQPVVSLVDGHITGVEALLRWQHPHFGTLQAGEFINSAANSGLLEQLLPSILHAACHTAAALVSLRHGTAPFVSVNLDPSQLATYPVLDLIRAALVSSGAPADSLVIEVTERAGAFDDPDSLAVVNEISGLGVQFAIDDFGTGHSSLDRLKRIPASKLKIDQSFVRDVVDDPEDQIIVGSVARLAAELGLDCVAEGIEGSGQAATVAGLGCTSGQGFLWSEAVSANEIEQQVIDDVSSA